MNTTRATFLTIFTALSAACSTSPVGPSDIAAHAASAVASDESTAAAPDAVTTSSTTGVAAAARPACAPTFSRGAVRDDFFLLTVRVPAGCQWFAIDREATGNYWDLTAPDYDLRNRQKYPYGVGGTGTQKVGVHFLRKIDWKRHRKLVVDVCTGANCDPGAPTATYRYTVR